jgi:hypothetical protein
MICVQESLLTKFQRTEYSQKFVNAFQQIRVLVQLLQKMSPKALLG